jgi:hypothetical protein
MDEIRVHVYHGRASQLANAMELCHDDMRGYSAAVGLLAVHSAISYNDAVQIKLTGRRTKSQDHSRAIRATEAACHSARIETRGIGHLEKLLSAKTDVSYGDERVDNRRVEFLYQAARAFRAWAEGILGVTTW